MIEVVAVIFSLICVYLTTIQNVWCWLTGMIGVTAYFFLFLQNHLYAETGLQVVFFLQSAYGWYNWKRKNSRLRVKEISNTRFIFNLILIIILSCILGVYLKDYTDSKMPLMDSFAAITSLFANQMLVKKKLQAWVLWVVVDILLIIIFIKTQMYLSIILYLVFMALSINGYYKWRKDLRMV